MQLIGQYYDLFEAEDIALRLREQGIATHISSRHSSVMSGFVTGAFKVGVWAVLDSQYEDACAFLADRRHKITTGLSAEELAGLEEVSRRGAYSLFNKLLIGGAVALAVVFVVFQALQSAPS